MNVLDVGSSKQGASSEQLHELSISIRELEQQHQQLSDYVKYVINNLLIIIINELLTSSCTLNLSNL